MPKGALARISGPQTVEPGVAAAGNSREAGSPSLGGGNSLLLWSPTQPLGRVRRWYHRAGALQDGQGDAGSTAGHRDQPADLRPLRRARGVTGRRRFARLNWRLGSLC